MKKRQIWVLERDGIPHIMAFNQRIAINEMHEYQSFDPGNYRVVRYVPAAPKRKAKVRK